MYISKNRDQSGHLFITIINITDLHKVIVSLISKTNYIISCQLNINRHHKEIKIFSQCIHYLFKIRNKSILLDLKIGTKKGRINLLIESYKKMICLFNDKKT